MSLTRVLEVLGQQSISPDDEVESALRRAVEAFPSNRTESINSIRQMQTKDPTEFVLAAARVLISPEMTKAAGAEYVAGIIHNSNSMVDPLLDERTPPEAALLLARGMAEAEPLTDARLMRKMLENAQGLAAAVPKDVALRVLWLIDRLSDCSRVAPYLMQLARHPSSEVRSKSALLLGRGNLNLMRVKQFLGSEDGRMRANAVESLWGIQSPQARDLFHEAATDPNRRVAVNALVGLCKAGERDAHSKLIELAGSADPIARRAAAWAMGQVGDPEFVDTLETLAKDDDRVLRTVATRSLALLNTPPENRRWAARAPETTPSAAKSVPSGITESVNAAVVPDLQSYPSRAFASPSAENAINPSARDVTDIIPDLQSYPLTSSSHPGR